MKIRFSYTLPLLIVLFILPFPQNANTSLRIEGINRNLKHHIEESLSTIRNNKINFSSQFKTQISSIIRERLRVFGYYSPVINIKFYPKNNNSTDVLVIYINKGWPVKIAKVNIILRGEARNDKDYENLIIYRKPSKNTILNHENYDKLKNGLSSLALSKGYFDADFRKSQLNISIEHYKAYYNIDFDSGRRYSYGKVRFHNSQIHKKYLTNISSIHEGVPYSANSLANLNHKLAATNWFSSIVISPDFNDSKNSKVISLDVRVVPRKQNSIEIGVGYISDTGLHLKSTWNKPWINSCGHSLESHVSFSKQEQIAYLNYKIPLLKNPLEQYYLFQYGFTREDINRIKYNSSTLNISRYWNFSSGWQRVVNIKWSLDHITEGNVTKRTMIFCPGISISRSRQRGILIPTWGDSQKYSLDISNKNLVSNINFYIIQIQSVWIRTFKNEHRFITRGNFGWIQTNNFKKIPPFLRFFVGGDRSIRGYKYKSISPQNKTNTIVGASKLITGSLEYQYNINRKWWGAIFFDIGEGVNNIRKSNYKIGIGVGVRWESPLGLIKMDIATPINDKREHSPQIYIGLGPEL